MKEIANLFATDPFIHLDPFAKSDHSIGKLTSKERTKLKRQVCRINTGIDSSNQALGRAKCDEVIRMNSSQFGIPGRYAEGTQAAALLLQRRQQLEDELLRFQRQRHEKARRERRIHIKYVSIASW